MIEGSREDQALSYDPFSVPKSKDATKNEAAKGKVPIWKIIRAFNRFYSFFHTGSITVSSVIFFGWMIALIFNFADSSARQLTDYESFSSQATVTSYFNPHWNVLIIGILILIFGLFLSYISAAIAKSMERFKE